MSYTPKQSGQGAGGSGGGQNAPQKTLVQQMQDAAHNIDAFTQAISSTQGFPNLNMSRQQQQQTQQRLDLYMKQQQFIFSNTQIQQLQQQIQQHIQQQQNAAIEPLALTRGQNQQQQANGNTAASVLANQQLQLQQAYAANPANLMQQLQAYQFQMQQQQQQQQQKMMPMNQAQQSLSSTFQANAAFQQQQQKFLAAAAAAQNKSMAAMNQQKGSMQMNTQPNVAQQTTSNNNLPNKSPARMTGTTQNFSKIPATIQPTSAKAPQSSQSPPVAKQTASNPSNALKSTPINVPGNVTITKAPPTTAKPQTSQQHPAKATANTTTSSLTITKSTVASSSQPLTPTPSKSNAINSNQSQSQSPKPAVTAATATMCTPAATTAAIPKTLQPKEAPAKADPKPESSPPVAKDAPQPQQPVAANESDSSSSTSLSVPQDQKQGEDEPPPELQTASVAAPVSAPTPTPTPLPPAPEKVPEENISTVAADQQKTEAEQSDDIKKLPETDQKPAEQETTSSQEDGANANVAAAADNPEPAPVSELSLESQSSSTAEPSKVVVKIKAAANQKKTTSPARSEPNTPSNDISKPAEKKKGAAATSTPEENAIEAKTLPVVEQEKSSTPSVAPPASLNKVENPETPKTNDSRRSRRHRLKTIPFQSPLPELAYITKLSVAEATAANSPKQTEDRLILFYKNEYLAVRNAESGFFICQTLQNVFRSSPKIRIRWLSEEKNEENVYIPDFYDTTDIECVLTTVEMEKVSKDRWRIPKAEKIRIENILKKAIDVEKGLAPRPEVTEENPDGLDISIYKNESQIEKRKQELKQNEEKSSRTAVKRTVTDRSKLKSPKKKRKTKSKKTSREAVNASELTESNDSEDETDTDKEYKPKKKSIVAQAKVNRAQRSPLARARAASPIVIRKDNDLKPKSTTVPIRISSTKKESSLDSSPTTSISRSDRAKRRAGLEATVSDTPAKKPAKTQLASRNASLKTPSEKTSKSSDEELLIPLPEKPFVRNLINKPSSAKKTSQRSTTSASGGDTISSISSKSAVPNRTTRSRK